jgi:heparin binding hemagglutinin HbhA
MATATQTDRSPVPTPLFAIVGATDLAVERVRTVVAGIPAVQAQFEARVSAVQADVEKRVSEFDPKTLGAKAQDVPNKAAARALEVASIGQQRYEALAVRGKTLLDSIRAQASTQQLINQAGNTVSRGKAAVTTARKAADDTYAAILGTIGVSRAEAEEIVTETRTAAKTAAKKTSTSAKKTTTTARKNTAATKSAAKGAGTSAKKTASTASKAATDARKKVGN